MAHLGPTNGEGQNIPTERSPPRDSIRLSARPLEASVHPCPPPLGRCPAAGDA
jgi:hypothetical protein